jgi:hypothetical protein
MNALAGLSLILALATGGLWGRSYWVAANLLKSEGGKGIYIYSYAGRLVVHARGRDGVWPGIRNWECYEDKVTGESPFPYSFQYENVPSPDNAQIRQITILFPHWSLLLALAILPALCGWQLLRSARRRSENLCPQCGYDLRATPQRCPECGHEMENNQGTKALRHEGTKARSGER